MSPYFYTINLGILLFCFKQIDVHNCFSQQLIALCLQVRWMKQNGFAGVMVWALDLDDFKNSCGFGKYPLLTAINQELGGGVISRPPSRPRKPKVYVFIRLQI